MRDYELSLIVSPDLTSEKRNQQLKKIEKLIADLKGKVKKTVDWGRKELVYSIKKKNLGSYFLWEIEIPEKEVANLDKKLKLEEEIIRYLLVRKEKPQHQPVRGKEGKHGAKVAK